jgi:hypothetical protein
MTELNDPDYGALKVKLQLALATQTRDNQQMERLMRKNIGRTGKD